MSIAFIIFGALIVIAFICWMISRKISNKEV